jgi:predicted dehydrogenase
MSRPRARLVVAGLGRIGRLHAENLAGRVASAELAGVVDADEPIAKSVGEAYDVAWSASLSRALDDPRVDAVVIAAPTSLHAELVELAVGAGKHVLCEKPLGFDLEAARHAVAAADAASVELQIGFQRRFDPDWVAVRQALDDGELGILNLLRGSHRDARPPAETLGGLFVDMAVHDFDAARWLGGEVAEVFALVRRGVGRAAALAAGIALRFESGALGLFDVSRDARYGFECSAELVGSQGTARTGHRHRHGEVDVLREGRVSARLPTDHAERHEAAYVAELEHFGELVLGRRAPRSTGHDAVAALELAQLAARSADLGAPLPVETHDLARTGPS